MYQKGQNEQSATENENHQHLTTTGNSSKKKKSTSLSVFSKTVFSFNTMIETSKCYSFISPFRDQAHSPPIIYSVSVPGKQCYFSRHFPVKVQGHFIIKSYILSSFPTRTVIGTSCEKL